jgi:signal transduction histidine kinase/CheY-like chemotaxis protein
MSFGTMRFPQILRSFPLILGVFTLPYIGAQSVPLAETAAGPRAFLVKGLPPEIREYRDMRPSPSGWVFSGGNGVVFQADTWRTWMGHYGMNMGCAAPLKSGNTLIAGYGFCSVLAPNGTERMILGQGAFYSLATDGVLSLVASASKAYVVSESGVMDSIDLKEDRSVPRAYRMDGSLVLFAPGNGTFEVINGKFAPSKRFSWADGISVHPVVFGETDSDFILATRNGIYVSEKGAVRRAYPELLEKIRDLKPNGVSRFGSQLVVSSYFEGMTGYSEDGARRLWNLPIAAFGGSPYQVRNVRDGILLCSTTGVYVVPDPSRYSYLTIPQGDIVFAGPTPNGTALCISSKAYSLGGAPLDFPDGTCSVLPLHGGYAVGLMLGRVRLPTGEVVSFADRDSPQLAEFGDGFVAAHGQKVTVFENGSQSEVPVPRPTDSIASVDSQLVLGTDRGAFVLSSDFKVERTFGLGHTDVFPLGEHEAVAFDSNGRLYDSTGFLLATLPFKELLSAVSWRGELVLLGHLPRGESLAIRLSPSGAMTALDLPIESPVALAVEDGRLCVIASGLVLLVSDPLPLVLPEEAPRVQTPSGSEQLSLAANEDTVQLQIPPARLGPWANPSYEYQVGGGKWEGVAAGARIPVPRLSIGSSTLSVRASLGTESRVNAFTVYRAYPLWLRWPAFIIYAAALAGLYWLALKVRLRRLAEKAQKLEAIIDEKTADLKTAQRAREEFFSSLSHEIRNPLNGVVGLCDILAEAPPGSIGPREKRIVNTLRGCAGQLRGMLDDVLDFSRIDRGEIQLSVETFDLVSAVEGSVRSVDVGLANSELVLPHDPVWVSGDCGKLRQIITNLASNGLKYGIPKRIRVSLATKVTREGSLAVQVSVSNTGNTISERELSTIFKGFARGEDAIKRRIPGHGLGLAVSRRMAHAMGGSLTAQSHEGLTVFSLGVVLAISDAPVAVAPTVHKARLSRALAIEDESYNRMVLGHILSQLGYAVDWAVDGASAMDRIRGEAYDLVLTDYLLPDLTGADLARKILLEAPDPKPPVIAVTAYSTTEKTSELFSAGVSQIVSKPVSLEKLRTAIMGLSAPTGRRSLDIASSRASCNFGPILATKGGAEALAGYAEDIQMAWAWTLETMEGDLAEAAKAVHEFRSKILVVEAMEAGALMAKLEGAVRLAEASEIRRLSDLLTPMIDAIAAGARAEAKKAQNRGPGVG